MSSKNPRIKAGKPYIGITGFRTKGECKEMLAFNRSSVRASTSTRLHIGVMTGRKKLQGLESKYNPGFLSADDLSQVFPDKAEDTMNTLHYADYSSAGEAVSDEKSFETIQSAIYACGRNLQAVQFDMVLPPPDVINHLAFSNPGLEWIIQLNPETLAVCQDDLDEVNYRLKPYAGFDYLLVDFSKGTGKPMDAVKTAEIIKGLDKKGGLLRRSWAPEIALAGGLGPDTLDLLGPFAGKHSIDAQGKLIREGSDKYNPFLDLEKCRHYLATAKSMFR